MHNKKGSSLIELSIVLALICIATMLSIRLIPSLTSGYLRSDLDLLYQTILYMQRRALTNQQQQIIALDIESDSYTFAGTKQKLTKGICFGTIPGVYGPPSSAYKPLTSACSFKGNQIKISSEGTIDSGAIYLTDEKKEKMSACTVAVSEYSYVRRYRWRNRWEKVHSQ